MGAGYGTNAVAVVDQNGLIETAVGDPGNCVFVDGTTGPCGTVDGHSGSRRATIGRRASARAGPRSAVIGRADKRFGSMGKAVKSVRHKGLEVQQQGVGGENGIALFCAEVREPSERP